MLSPFSGRASACVLIRKAMKNGSSEGVLACQFHSWYPRFEKNTIKSRIVPLPTDFIKYLGEDGVILPNSMANAHGIDHLSEDEDLIAIDEQDTSINRPMEFGALESVVRSSIKDLGGEVFVKLNWSCPSDAKWVNNGTLKSYNFSDIILLLKSSDRVTFDLEHVVTNMNIDYTLILRKWANLQPSMEFRVFVCNQSIVAISQRDCTTFYKFLIEDKIHIEQTIREFFKAHVKGNFELCYYTLDVYIDKRNRVWIIDFNVWGGSTNPLLFTWEELELIQSSNTSKLQACDQDRSEDVCPSISCTFTSLHVPSSSSSSSGVIVEACDCACMRVVGSESLVMSSDAGFYRAPIDVAYAPDFSQFVNICRQQQQRDTDDSDNDDDSDKS